MAADSCLTTTRINEVHYTWVIEHYSFCHIKGENLRSLRFNSPTDKSCIWFLKLKNSSEKSDYVGLSLKLLRGSKCKRVFAKFKFSIVDARHEIKYSLRKQLCRFEIAEGETASGWGFSEFIKKKVLLNGELLQNDKLRITCDIKYSAVDVFTGAVNECTTSKLQLQSPTDFNLSDDLEQLLKNSNFTDVVLMVNGKQYPAHKCILAARSLVFAAMFKYDMKETQNACVDIVDTEEDLIEEMLFYIYTGRCKNLDAIADRLLGVTDKYDLQGLKLLCQKTLLKKLTADNAADLLSLANLHCAQELKHEILDFIGKNSTEVMDTTTWKSFAPKFPAELIMEVCQALSRPSWK